MKQVIHKMKDIVIEEYADNVTDKIIEIDLKNRLNIDKNDYYIVELIECSEEY